MLYYQKKLKRFSRELRKNMTDAEILLWSKLRMKQVNDFQFYRQKPIGKYIVDFYCPQAKMVIEVDGGQHYSEKMLSADKVRDQFLKQQGLQVLRYSDTEILTNIEGVLYNILENLNGGEHKSP
jgi:very-short-patch-repair endonuclease